LNKSNIRVPPELRRKTAIAAKKLKLSINRFVEKAISDERALLRP
jgi:predicted HicB family RNase H-like nuclease